MQIQDLRQQPAGQVSASPKRRRRTILLGVGALALVMASIGTAAALGGRPSPSAQSHQPSGTVAAPGLVAAAPALPNGQAAPKATTSTPIPVLADGTYPTYITKVDVDGATITIDVIQLFENEAAVNAAIEDGMTANDAQYLYVYIRNQNPRLRTLPFPKDVTIEFAHPCEVAKPKARLEELRKDTTDFPSLYLYEVTVVHDVIQRISQRLAQAAC